MPPGGIDQGVEFWGYEEDGELVGVIRFYERNGFPVVGQEDKDRLLRRYWSIPERQIETSVVLVGGAPLGDIGVTPDPVPHNTRNA